MSAYIGFLIIEDTCMYTSHPAGHNSRSIVTYDKKLTRLILDFDLNDLDMIWVKVIVGVHKTSSQWAGCVHDANHATMGQIYDENCHFLIL